MSPGRGRGRKPDPNEQELPEFPPDTTTGVERWHVDYVEVGNKEVMVVDYLVRDGVVTDERRERNLTEAEVATLYSGRQKKTFSEWMDHVSSLAD